MQFDFKFSTEPITDAKSAVAWEICLAGQFTIECLEKWVAQEMKPYISQQT
jgi:hypothetical protein